MSDDGMALMGALMARSASDLAWTRDRIEEGLRDEVTRLRKLVLEMSDVFDGATVVDRETEQRWSFLQPRIWSAADAQARDEAAS